MRWPRFYRKKFLQRHSWTRALFMHQDVPTRFWDGQVRSAPRRVARIFDLWRRLPELKMESDVAFQAYRGGDVIDVGAAAGWYSCLLGPSRPAKMLAMEPDPAFYPECLQTLTSLQALFPETSFIALPQACGSGKPLRFTYQHGHLAQAGPGTSEPVGSLPTLPLDRVVEFFALQPGFIKVDVEGFEEEVLAGARGTISRHLPVLLLELHKFCPDFSGVRTRLETWLVSLGYGGRTFFQSDTVCRTLWTPATS